MTRLPQLTIRPKVRSVRCSEPVGTTDVKDCEWLADLLRHGLLRPSFVSPRPQRESRELTRYRTSLVPDGARYADCAHTNWPALLRGRSVVASGRAECDQTERHRNQAREARPRRRPRANGSRSQYTHGEDLPGRGGSYRSALKNARRRDPVAGTRTSSGLVEWLERRHVPGVNAGGGLPETLVNALTT